MTRHTHDQPGPEPATTMVCFPTRRNPRLFLPADNPVVAASGLSQFARAQQGLGRMAISAAAVALRMGAARGLPVSHHWTDRSSALLRRLDTVDRLGPVSLSLRAPSDRPNSKPVVCVHEGDTGEPIAFAKIGTDPASAGLVRAEATNLNRLHGEQLPARLHVPSVLYDGSDEDPPILVVGALRGASGQASIDEVAQVSGAFAHTGTLEHAPLASSQFWRAVRRRLGHLREGHDGPIVNVLAVGVDRLEQAVGDLPMVFGRSHGDWIPANVAPHEDGVAAWDWERASWHAPIGLDMARYLSAAGQHPDHPAARSHLLDRLAGQLGVDRAQMDLAVVLERLEMAMRFAESAVLVPERQLRSTHWLEFREEALAIAS